jgi:class 3 adenylate cyclase
MGTAVPVRVLSTGPSLLPDALVPQGDAILGTDQTMALQTSAVEHRDGDYFGPPLNRVARLLDAGHGGQILL